jgi:hypothetical protein
MQAQAMSSKSPKQIGIDTIILLADKGHSHGEIAKIVGCSAQNIQARLANYDYNGLKTFRERKDSVFERIQCELANSLNADDIKNMAARDRIMGIGILEDKIRLLRGQSTENVLSVSVIKTLDERTGDLKTMLESLKSVDNSAYQPVIRNNVIEHDATEQIPQLNQPTSDTISYVNLRDSVTQAGKSTEAQPRRRGRKAKGR